MRQLKIATQITNRDSQAVEKYLQDISKIDMITPEQEVALAIKIKAGDEKALDDLVKANLRFVVSVAKQYLNQGMSLSDLINEGNIGLVTAAKRFDHTRGFKFISYAVWRIRQSILQGLAEQGRLVRVPQNKIGSYNKANKAYNAFEQEREREPSTEELAELLEMDEKDITQLFMANQRHTSLDAEIGGDNGDGFTLGDTLHAASDEIDAAGGTYKNDGELSESIYAFLKLVKLDERETDILFASFGIGGKSVEEIGRKYDISKERVRQVKERIMKKIQKKNAKTTLLRDNIRMPVEEKSSSSNNKQDTESGWPYAKNPLTIPKSFRTIDNNSIPSTEQTTTEKVSTKDHNTGDISTEKSKKQKNNRKSQTKKVQEEKKETTTSTKNGETNSIISQATSTLGKTLSSETQQELLGKLQSIYTQLNTIYTSLSAYQSNNNSYTDTTLIESIVQQINTLHNAFHTHQEQYENEKKHDFGIEEQCSIIDKKLHDIYDVIQVIKKHNIAYSNTALEGGDTQQDNSIPEVVPTEEHSVDIIVVPEDLDNIVQEEAQQPQEIAPTSASDTNSTGTMDIPISNDFVISETGEKIAKLLEGKDNLPECIERKKAYSRTQEKIDAMFAQGYDWKKHLEELEYNKHSNEYVSINTFMHYYHATKNSSAGKRESFSAILTRAKRFTGKVINEDTFYGYIVDFLQSIRKIIL